MACVLQTASHDTYRTAELRRLAQALSLDEAALPDGYSHPVTKGILLTVHKSRGMVDHIGRQLFSDEVRTHITVPVLDFLERYFLQLKYPPQSKTARTMVRDDDFQFLTGSISATDEILPTDAFSFSYDSHCYQASWGRNGSTFLSVRFPVEYELISGENKIEAENNIQADIQHTPITSAITGPRLINNGTYLSKEFSNRLYHKGDTLVFSVSHPAETAANMLLCMEAAIGYSINITQLCYGFKKNTFCVPLQQWIAFCHNTNCELYFGLEDINDKGDMKAVILAVNEHENYNHVLTVSVPSVSIEEHRGILNARLYPYVPTHNVKNMFAAYQKSNPKTIINE